MFPIRLLATLGLALAVAGCANLQEVRDFAGESAKLSANTELTTRFRDTYQREQPYLSGAADQQAQANDKRRQEAYQDLLAIHRNVTAYLQTLATLAGDKTFDLSPGIDAIGKGIKAYPDLGLDSRQVDAYAGLAKIVGQWATSAAQDRAVRDMVREGDPHLQVLLEGMATLVGYYRKTNENERKSVLGFLEVETLLPKDRLLAALGKAHLQAKTREYQAVEAQYAEVDKGIRRIQAGHKALAENADRLSAEEARVLLQRFAKDIKTVRSTLQVLGAH